MLGNEFWLLALEKKIKQKLITLLLSGSCFKHIILKHSLYHLQRTWNTYQAHRSRLLFIHGHAYEYLQTLWLWLFEWLLYGILMALFQLTIWLSGFELLLLSRLLAPGFNCHWSTSGKQHLQDMTYAVFHPTLHGTVTIYTHTMKTRAGS